MSGTCMRSAQHHWVKLSPNSKELITYKNPSKAQTLNNIRMFREFFLIPRKKAEIRIPNTIVVPLCMNDSICININFLPPYCFIIRIHLCCHLIDGMSMYVVYHLHHIFTIGTKIGKLKKSECQNNKKGFQDNI